MQAGAHDDCAPPCRAIAAATVAGALQLVRFGATLAAEPTCTARLIDACAALARAHVALPNSDPTIAGQVRPLHVARGLFMSTLC
jgi:hypothetical protein